MSVLSVARVTSFMRPWHRGQVRMSVANTLRRSQGQGCREGGEGAGGGGSSVAGMRTSKRGSCSGSSSTSGDALGTTSDRTREWGSEDTAISQHVEPRRRDESAEAREKIQRVENDRARPVFPGGLEAVANSAVLTNVESVLGERRPGHVTAEALESLAVAAVDRDLGVDVDAADFGDRVVRGGATRESGTDEFRGLVSRGLSEELEVVCGGGVAGGEDGAVVMERVAASFVDDAFEGPAVTVEHADHTRRRPGHVTAEALESLAVAAVDRDLGVDVDAADFGDRVVRGGATRESGTDEFRGLVSRGLSEELEVVCGGGVAGGEDGAVVMERVAASFVDDAFEGPAVTVEHADHTRVSPGGHLCDIVVRRRLEGVEGQLSFFVADVDAVEREGMKVNIHAERTVASLHEGDGAGEGVLH